MDSVRKWFCHAGVLIAVAALPRFTALAALPLIAERTDLSFGETVKRIKAATPPAKRGYWRFLDERIYAYPLTEDERTYTMLARNALAGKGFSMDEGWFIVPPGKPTSYWNCLYPLFITVCFTLFGEHLLPVWLIQITFSATSCFLIWRLAGTLFGRTGTWIAYSAAVLYPPYILNSIWIMTEALAVPLVIIFLFFVYRGLSSGRIRDFVFAGVTFGAASLTRSTVFYFLPLLMLGIWIAAGRYKRSEAFKFLTAFIIASFFVILPWTYRNWRVHNAFMLIDTKIGVNLWMFNNPNQEFGYTLQNSDMPLLEFGPDATEVEMDRAYYELGKNYLLNHKTRFLKNLGLKALLALNPVPKQAHSGKLKVVGLLTAGWLLILTPLGIFAGRRRGRELTPVYFLMAYWIFIQAGSAAGMRYRMPAEVGWLLFAAAGVVFSVKTVAAPFAAKILRLSVSPRYGRARES